MDYGQQNLIWANALIDGLVDSGSDCFVLSPGSRSTPLALACTRHPDVRSWVQQDERSAAFFALGLSKAIQRPVAVIATSGTAPANWFPALIEASQDNQSLLFISADRPPELQDCGANQTIDQFRLFGHHTRAFYALPVPERSTAQLRYVQAVARRAVDRSQWPVPGPIHINVPFREPLVPDNTTLHQALSRRKSGARICFPRLSLSQDELTHLANRITARNGVIVCGRSRYPLEFAEAITNLAQQLSCPVFADPLSGLRFGPHDHATILVHYDAFLRREHFCIEHRPHWVLRFGGVPTSLSLQRYLAEVDDESTLINVPHGPWPDPTHTAGHIIHADPTWLCKALCAEAKRPAVKKWLEEFQDQERRAATLLKYATHDLFEAAVLSNLCQHCPDGTTLFCGNSMIIRDVDNFVAGGPRLLNLVGNRGASGIDGNVSTVLGLAAGSTAPVIGLIGDLALYHDMNGLLASQDVTAVFIVFNNGGGAIFSYLPQARLAHFERYWLTPTKLDISKVADLYGLKHRSVNNVAQFEHVLLEFFNRAESALIEIVVDRTESIRHHQAYWEAVAGNH
jgi:2-succinyl-5-enolpyruvyl-6-hydroxy-3-cyclohexene-1-carboxylate synthase